MIRTRRAGGALTAMSLSAAALGALALSVAPSDPVRAQEPEQIVDRREDLMKGMGRASKTLTEMARGQTPFERATALESARVIQESAPRIASVFPESTAGVSDDALPVIWEDFAGFEEAASRLETTSGGLVSAVEGAEAPADYLQALQTTGQACGGCHEDFRKPDE